MGPFDYDQLKTVFVTHALGDHYANPQSVIQSITKPPTFSVDDVARRILRRKS